MHTKSESVSGLPVDFDWREYLSINTDVAEVFSTEKEATEHWLNHGFHEGRAYKCEDHGQALRPKSTQMFPKLDVLAKPGVLIEPETPVVAQLPTDFDWEDYLAINADVAEVCKSEAEAINHWMNHGFAEGRAYRAHFGNINGLPVDFNWREYLSVNADVAATFTTKDGAIDHWLNHGRHEGRRYRINSEPPRIPPDFDWQEYLLINRDVADLTDSREGAVNHWLNYGCSERRRYKFKI